MNWSWSRHRLTLQPVPYTWLQRPRTPPASHDRWIKGVCDMHTKYYCTRFYNWFTTVRNKVTNSLLPRFCFISEEFILKHHQSMGFCQHDGTCFTPIQNNRWHYRSGLCIYSSI